MADRPQEELVARAALGDVTGKENLFVCPECDVGMLILDTSPVNGCAPSVPSS